MPFDGKLPIVHDLTTSWGRLRHLADIVESKEPREIRMSMVDSSCGTAHCAWGWAQETPELRKYMAPRMYGASLFGTADILITERGSDPFSGIDKHKDFVFCFGIGEQFTYLNSPYTPSDVARHLRIMADRQEAKQAKA